MHHLTITEAAGELGAEPWRVRRLFEDGTLPEPPRFARARDIRRKDLPAIREALQARGWLPAEAPEGETLQTQT